MIVVFNLDLTDHYLTSSGGDGDGDGGGSDSAAVAQMFSGWGPTDFNTRGYALLAVVGVLMLLAFAAMRKASRVAVERSAKARELMIKMFVQSVRAMEGDAITYGLSPCVDRTGTLVAPEYSSDVGLLKGLRCAPFDARPVRLGGATPELLLRATRFVGEFHPQPVSIVGPSPLVDACHTAGVPRTALALRFSPFSRLNLPLAARKAAHIPIPAVQYAFVHPVAELAPVHQATVGRLAQAFGTAAAVLTNGGYAYIDQAGVLLALNAIVPAMHPATPPTLQPPDQLAPTPPYVYAGDKPATRESAAAGASCATASEHGDGDEPSFRLIGPFATPRLAYEELVSTGRFEPVVSPPTLGAGARTFAWIRNDEFGLHAPFGGFAFTPGVVHEAPQQQLGAARGVYFALLPRNVPQATVTVDLAAIAPSAYAADATGTGAGTGGGAAGAANPSGRTFTLAFPLRSRVVEVKRGIEAQVAVSVDALRLFGPWFGPKEQAAPQEMRDDLPLEEFGVTNGAVVTLRVERKQARPRGTGAGECEGVSLSVSSLEEE